MRYPLRVTLWGQRPGLGGPLPIRWQRRYLDALAATLPEPRGTRHEWTTLDGVRTLRVAAGTIDPDGAVLFLHGGAYTTGSPRSHRSLAAYLSKASGRPVFLPDYRLAPEHPFPAALEDAVSAFDALAARYELAPDRIVLAGDSAGGGLAVAAAARLVAAGRTPAGLALVAPWVDIVREPDQRRDRVVRAKWGRRSAAQYVGAGDPAAVGINPGRDVVAGLPPILIHVGTEEILRPQVRDFADATAAAGVDVTLREFDWMWHSAHCHAGLFANARDAVDELGRFVRDRLSQPVDCDTVTATQELR